MNISTAKGFTLVESLVAISILMLAIVGPMTVANKALTAAIDAERQTYAYNLAQEELEYINNEKDNSTDTNPAWPSKDLMHKEDWNDNHYPSVFTDCVSQSNACDMPIPNEPALATGFIKGYYLAWTSYYYQVLATAYVTWSTGGVTSQVTSGEIITDYDR